MTDRCYWCGANNYGRVFMGGYYISPDDEGYDGTFSVLNDGVVRCANCLLQIEPNPSIVNYRPPITYWGRLV